MESKFVQAQLGPGVGLYTGVRGTAELIGALSDLYLDTNTLDTVEKVLPQLDLDEVYGNEAGVLLNLLLYLHNMVLVLLLRKRLQKE